MLRGRCCKIPVRPAATGVHTIFASICCCMFAHKIDQILPNKQHVTLYSFVWTQKWVLRDRTIDAYNDDGIWRRFRPRLFLGAWLCITMWHVCCWYWTFENENLYISCHISDCMYLTILWLCFWKFSISHWWQCRITQINLPRKLLFVYVDENILW